MEEATAVYVKAQQSWIAGCYQQLELTNLLHDDLDETDCGKRLALNASCLHAFATLAAVGSKPMQQPACVLSGSCLCTTCFTPCLPQHERPYPT